MTNKQNIIQIGHITLIIMLVVAIGIFIINQFISFEFKNKTLINPCGVCADLNKNQSTCINQCFQKGLKLYPYGNQLIDNFGNCYSTKGISVKCNNALNITMNFSLINQ